MFIMILSRFPSLSLKLIRHNHGCGIAMNYKIYRTPCSLNQFSNQIWKYTSTRYYHASGENGSMLEEIYVGPLSKKLQILKLFTTTTSCIGIFVLYNIHNRIEFPNQTIMFSSFALLLFLNFVSPLLINFISKKYCVKMYYDKSNKEYTAVIYTYLFKRTLIKFTPEDVVVPTVNRFFTVANIKGYPLFFDAHQFSNVNYYKNIMGYDKPLDFELAENKPDESSKSISSNKPEK